MVLQTFGFTVEWNRFATLNVELVNAKIFVGLNVKKVYSNYNHEDGIDGIQVYAQEWKGTSPFRWINFKRTRPYEYSFKTSMSFNRYASYYEKKEEGSPKVMIVDTQLTDEIVKQFGNTSQF